MLIDMKKKLSSKEGRGHMLLQINFMFLPLLEIRYVLEELLNMFLL